MDVWLQSLSGMMSSTKLLQLLLTVCIVALPVHATIVVFQWTPTQIFLAADSLSTKVDLHTISSVIQCKIHQVGNIFFTIVGVNDDPAIKVDLVAIAKQSARTKGGILEKESRFEVLAKDQIKRIMSHETTVKLGLSEQERVNIIFVDSKSHTLISKEYVRNTDGSTSSLPRKIYSVPSDSTGYIAVGVYSEAQKSVLSNPRLSQLDGAPFIAGFIQSQIDYEQYRLSMLHAIPRVGGNICILKIEHGIASWVSGYQQPCPAIEQ
jgi:hypothetical protein